MERAVVHSNLNKTEIQPSSLLREYQSLLEQDIRLLLPSEKLQPAACPVTGERSVQKSFQKMGMHYQVSQRFGNIYLSPRPEMPALKEFYLKSEARKFWQTELWPRTAVARMEKVIQPQLEWAQGFLYQFSLPKRLRLAEFLPNHWGYGQAARKAFPNAEYLFVEALFDLHIAASQDDMPVSLSQAIPGSLDAVFLFEAIDRSPNPSVLLSEVKESLKPGGLCFITSLLASGFEVQVLGEEADLFVPPERMNLLTYEGMQALIEQVGGFELLEFSTPGVLDISNVTDKLDRVANPAFYNYIFTLREDAGLVRSFQDFLQINRLGTFGRLVLMKS